MKLRSQLLTTVNTTYFREEKHMANKQNKIKFLSILLSIVFLTATPIVFAEKNEISSTLKTINLSQNFSEPDVTKIGQYIDVKVEETDTNIFMQGSPDLPVFRKTYELFWDSTITDITFSHSEVKNINLSNSIKSVPVFKNINGEIIIDHNIKSVIYENNETLFPNSWYSVEKNAGLNKQGEHVLFLTLNIYPVRFNKEENMLNYITEGVFEIDYEESSIEFSDPDVYDLVIISPSIFSNNLTSLVTHKNSYGLKTNITLLEDIYDSYPGIDKTEQIKYFIKDAVENWGTKYVLLVGEMRILPIRKTDAYPWGSNHGEGILSDLYYADIYNSDYNFCSWDNNEDGVFGQIKYNWSFNTIDAEILDEVDLYPDVHVGRLACRNIEEVDLCVKKIISYETETYGEDWFKKIILAGGDTFPPGKGSAFSVFEGEITNNQVAEEMPDFEHIKLWSSKRNLNAFTFNRAINKGAGFLTYAGHGFEHGWGTYKPNALRSKMGITNSLYYTPFLQFLNNEDMLPIVFFDACLTAKLDFWVGDLASYYSVVRKFVDLMGVEINSNNHLPCFAWCFMIEEGGAIGTIGATRPAYSFVDDEGIHAGAGYLDWMFFKEYSEGDRLGEMLTNAQISYIQGRFMDYFTIEEYILLGDPSLMVGGYP